jgi:hypothetical protein
MAESMAFRSAIPMLGSHRFGSALLESLDVSHVLGFNAVGMARRRRPPKSNAPE